MELQEKSLNKSTKTPKLIEEISEISLKSPLISEKTTESNVLENEQSEDEFDLNLKEILKEIINSAPAGQSQQVSLLCQELFKNKSLNLKEFIANETRYKLIKDALPIRKFLVTEDNYNRKGGEVKIGNELIKFSDFEIDSFEMSKTEETETFEIQLQNKLENYVKELFPGTGSLLLHKENENKWKIHILGQRIKPKTFWSGNWHSIWEIEFKENEKEVEVVDEDEDDSNNNDDNNNYNFTINGKIELIVHYHEDGCVQLSSEKEIKSIVEIKANSINQAVDKINWKIRDSEDSFQLSLNEAYQQLAETIFKKLRRQLPVTRTKMDWSKFVNYNLSNELKK